MAQPTVEYWVTCMLDPWPTLAADDAFGEIVDALRDVGEYSYDEVDVTLEEGGPSFVPTGSVVLHVVGPKTANWDEVLALLDAIAAAGEGIVFSSDRNIMIDRRTQKPGTKAFKESPAWATELAAKHASLEIIVFGMRDPGLPTAQLQRMGLAALAERVQFLHLAEIEPLTSRVGLTPGVYILAIGVTAPNPVDALVAAQALVHSANGCAFALAPNGTREQLPP